MKKHLTSKIIEKPSCCPEIIWKEHLKKIGKTTLYNKIEKTIPNPKKNQEDHLTPIIFGKTIILQKLERISHNKKIRKIIPPQFLCKDHPTTGIFFRKTIPTRKKFGKTIPHQKNLNRQFHSRKIFGKDHPTQIFFERTIPPQKIFRKDHPTTKKLSEVHPTPEKSSGRTSHP